MGISASVVKELREKTSAGMMDCKKALEETQGNFDAAVEWLRKKGLASAAKKASRIATEGMVSAYVVDGKVGVLLETNSETDFVAKNDLFKSLVAQLTEVIAKNDTSSEDITAITALKMPSGKTVDEELKESISKIGENLVLRRFEKIKTNGYVHSYIHGEGRMGVLVELSKPATHQDMKSFAHDVCLHVAAMNPLSLSPDEVPADVIAKEREIFKAKNLEQGKKPEIVDKIVDGQIKKFLAENCLLEQAFVKNPDQTVKEYWKSAQKSSGVDFSVVRYIRYELGEGLQKKSNNFAEEVAAQTQAL